MFTGSEGVLCSKLHFVSTDGVVIRAGSRTLEGVE